MCFEKCPLIFVSMLFSMVCNSQLTGPTDGHGGEAAMIAAAARNITGDANFAQKLVTKLLYNYNKEAVLVRPIVIHMDLLLLQVKNTNEKEGTLETVIAAMIEWKDFRMQWNPEEYSNLTFLSLTTDQVWLPDIAMTNSADHPYAISRDQRFTVRVSHDGTFKFVPAGTATTWCSLKLFGFPFDIQKCALEFESWSLDSSTMTFDGYSNLLVDEAFVSLQFQLCEYNALTYEHLYPFAGETFTRVRFIFTVKRKTTFYVINLIFPILILSFIQTLGFLIPCNTPTADRIAFGTTNMLTLVVYQTILTEQLPKTSDAVTALTRYVIVLIMISALGIFESVMVERLQSRTMRRPPFILVRLLRRVPVLMYETKAEMQRRKSCIPLAIQSMIPFAMSSKLGNDKNDESNESVGSEDGKKNGEATEKTERVQSPPFFSPRPTALHRQNKRPTTKLKTARIDAPLKAYEVDEEEINRMWPERSIKELSCASCTALKLINEQTGGEKTGLGRVFNRQGSLCKDCRRKDTLIGRKVRRARQRLLAKRATKRQDKLIKAQCTSNFYKYWLSTEPSFLWAELSFKIDCLSFFFCTAGALAAPIIIFLPIIISGAMEPCEKPTRSNLL